ncbi:Bug family tripartite tricarboxylate transporter substrate binding protein [Achromobacter denitrificans]|uniref:Bug family tripartite tricarboxylate transporter substrate binding protein n=1 Tax=Achromobacter denitrificans TaxID=32002 RepID=UPI00240E8A35|nr:tripartite tricarboxylate transporter substrate-binding protein [Achromobacter denitrificans]
MKQSAIRLIMAACIATAPLAAHAAQDNYPQKPITLQLGFPPGQATDTVARMLAERAAARLGQPVIVENKPGQGGSVLLSSFVRQPPDGYTLTIAATGAGHQSLSVQDGELQDPGRLHAGRPWWPICPSCWWPGRACRSTTWPAWSPTRSNIPAS